MQVAEDEPTSRRTRDLQRTAAGRGGAPHLQPLERQRAVPRRGRLVVLEHPLVA